MSEDITKEPAEEKDAVNATSEPAAVTPEDDASPAPAEKKEEKKNAEKGKLGFWGFLLDLLLVAMLTGALGGGGWYLYREMEKYRIPSQMEIAVAEHAELCKERDGLQDAAFHADEQLHMRQRLENLNRQLSDLRTRIAEKKTAVDKERARVIEVQNEILREDKTLRGVARGLLPGTPIGDVTNKRGKVYRNAVIHALKGNRITLRHPEGQANFPVRELVKDNLPDIVRYAFGLDDLVDTSDFEITKGQPAPKKRKGKLINIKATEQHSGVKDYEPTTGTPVVDTNASATSTITADDDAPAPEDDNWEMPEDEE